MKKPFILIALSFMILQSCNAQSFDLADVKFPVDKASLTKYKLEDKQILELDYRLFKSVSPDVLHFNKASLSGHTGNANDDIAGTNLVYFYSNDKTGKIQAYKVETYTTPETKKLITAIESKLGKAVFDRGQDNRFRIWESADKKTIYLLESGQFSLNNDPKTASARFFAIDRSAKDLVDHRLTSGFQYYKDYLFEKSKKTGKYTYADFLKDMKAQGEGYYLKGDNTIK
ncbi:hypothetical protein [Pedobacter sp. HMWF019]|uniref:hypothetical protein n=1 Tax=Pedobacter sp. HMWF019 TaxID=2056856 RepID=UPI0011B21CDB|nr:hypothetical protein [Pedobacter sp. HMWF019]